MNTSYVSLPGRMERNWRTFAMSIYRTRPLTVCPSLLKTWLFLALQEDEVGCQTGVYRERDGSVILWHTEEDYEQTPGERFDQLRLFSFRAADQRIATGFIYPDLLPGPTFGWHGNDFMQAIDTLHIKPVDFEDALMPNALAWLSLYLGTQVTREELSRSLGPFQGGYSLTALSKTGSKVGVEKIEFANADHTISHLESDAGCYLFQTNVIADLSLPIGVQEQTSPESRAWNEARMARTAGFMKDVQKTRMRCPPFSRCCVHAWAATRPMPTTT